jgi:hypothetical protein
MYVFDAPLTRLHIYIYASLAFLNGVGYAIFTNIDNGAADYAR